MIRLLGTGTGGGVVAVSTGLLLVFFGLQFLLIKKIADNFVSHHQTGKNKRKKYIKEIFFHPDNEVREE